MRGRWGLVLAIAGLAGARCPAAHGDDASDLAAAVAASPTPRNALALVELLASRDGAVRAAAAADLGRFGRAAAVAVPALVDLVAAEDEAAGAAVAALSRIAAPSDRQEVEGVLRSRLGAGHENTVLVLLRMGVADAAVQAHLVKFATTADGAQRLAVVRALASLVRSTPALADVLASFLEDPDPIVRARAANRLRWHPVHGAHAQTRVVTALNDPSPELRVLALEGAGDRGILAKEELPGIVARLTDADPDVRAAAASAVASTGPYARPHVAVLAARVADPDARVRMAAVRALIHVGSNSNEVPGALARFAEDLDPAIRRALVEWRRKRATDARTLALLEEGLSDPDASVREVALKSAAALAPLPETVLTRISDLLRDADAGVREAALESAAALAPLPETILARRAELLRDADAGVRRAAVAAFGSSARPEAERIGAVVPLLADPVASVRRAACAAVAEMPSYDPAPELPLLLAELDRTGEEPRAVTLLVGRAGPAGVDALLERLRGDVSTEWEGRYYVLEALAAARPSPFERADVRRLLLPFWIAAESPADSPVAGLGAVFLRFPEELRDALLLADDWVDAGSIAELLVTARPQGVELLVESIREDEWTVRPAVRRALEKVSVDVVWPIASRHLDDEDARARVSGVQALDSSTGEWPVPAAARVVVALRDEDWRVRRAAADAFQHRLLAPGALDALAALLADRFGDVRESALWALIWHGRAARGAFPSVLARIRAGIGASEQADLVVLLGAIATRFDTDVAAALVERLADPEARVAASARSALESLRPTDPRAVLALAALLDRSEAQEAAARTLGLYGPGAASALPALERAALSGSPALRQAAAAALPAVRGDVAAWVALLTAELTRTPSSVTTIEELADLGSGAAAALPALHAILDMGRRVDGFVLEAAREAIRRIEVSERK